MTRTLMVLLAVAVGCGDDDVDPMDAGGGDDAAPTGDLGDGRDELALSFQIDDGDEAPIEGAFVTVDTPAGRFETTTDAMGAATLDVRATDGDRLVFQYAKEGYRISAIEGSYDAANPPSETFEVVLVDLIGGLTGPRTRVSFTLSGLPAGGRACTNFDNFSICHPANDASPEIAVPPSFLGDDVRIFILDGSDGFHDYAVAPLTEVTSGLAASMTIDGTPELSATSRDLRLLVPEGETSRLATSELPDRWAWWAVRGDIEIGHYASVCGAPSREGNAIVGRCHFLDVGEATEGVVTVWADTNLMSQAGRTSRLFGEAEIPDEVTLLGTARVSGDTAIEGGSFGWEAPEIPADVTGESSYLAVFANASGVVQRQLLTRRTSDITLPSLPEGFDREVSYPFAGSGGTLTVRTLVSEEDPSSETSRLLLASTSEPHPITF